jgi:subtilisin family serine protease
MTTRAPLRSFAALLAVSVVVTACGGGGGGGAVAPGAVATAVPTAAATATPAPTPTPITTESVSVPASTVASQTATYAVTNYSGTATIPAASVATTLATTFSISQPSSTPTIQNVRRRPQNIGASPIGALAFVCITPAATVSFGAYPAFTLTVPAAVAAGINFAYVALYDPTNPSLGWTTIEGPANPSNSTIIFSGASPGQTFQGGQTYCFLIFTLASALPTPTPAPTATSTPKPASSTSPSPAPSTAPTATPTPATEAAFVCPSSDAGAAVERGGVAAGAEAIRRAAGLRVPLPAAATPGLLAVSYSASIAGGAPVSIASRERLAGGSMVRSFTFARTGKVIHVLSVPAQQMSAIASTLRSQPGVESVDATGGRRYATTVNAPYYPNDPYFSGFTQAQNATAGNPSAANPASSTYRVAPFDESSVVPGQWDMHAIKLEDALAYSQTGNGSGIVNANALGSSSIKLAIIDTGEDSTHPELAGKIARQRCFITDPNGNQSTSSFETDPLGHGTDVTGIAAADSNNALGFSGAGGQTSIYAYRVFPTPDDTCASDTSTDQQCGAETSDIASAIDDAVSQGVNIISMSLGGSTCGSGSGFAPNGDSDPVEGAAVAEAIAANVVVVAASGNSGTRGIASPGCDTGVIAVGATSLADGTANGSRVAGGSPASPVEYVTSYTQYGSTNTYRSASSWGIVAPGGDPSSDTDADDLHWIENIWTSAPFTAYTGDTTFAGECTNDYPYGALTTSPDCRTLIAGTSMATPHVAGVAALILAVNPAYQSPSAMRTLLCQTADNVGGNQGCGRLNAYRAMATALGDPSLP